MYAKINKRKIWHKAISIKLIEEKDSRIMTKQILSSIDVNKYCHGKIMYLLLPKGRAAWVLTCTAPTFWFSNFLIAALNALFSI